MIHIVILYFTVYSLGYDGSLLNGLQALPSWQRDFVSRSCVSRLRVLTPQDTPTGTKLGLIAASYYLPKIPLAPLFSILTDRYGRRAVIAIGVFFMLAGAIVAGFSYSVAQFIGARVLLGVGTVAARKSRLSALCSHF
jgi:MFS family permease